MRFTLILVHLLTYVLLSCAQSNQPLPAVQQTLTHPLGDTVFQIKVTTFGNRNHPVFVKLHDNEQTAEEAALQLLQQQGGQLIRLENAGRRLVEFPQGSRKRSFDPNRIFSPEGITTTLRNFNDYTPEAARAIASFAQFLLQQLPDTGLIIAIHNNTDQHFSILDYLPGGRLAAEAAEAFHAPGQDADDFILTTDPALFEAFRQQGFNAVLQAEQPEDDGSLSVYFGLRKRPYINIETEHGHLLQQREMLDLLMRQLEQ